MTRASASANQQGSARRSRDRRGRRLRPLALALIVCMIGAACEKAQTGGPPLTDVTSESFSQLRWMVGDWQGTDLNSDTVFFEVNRAIDDSTITIDRFTDSTLLRPFESARIELRRGRAYYRTPKQALALIGIATRSAIFWPEGASGGGITFNTQHGCSLPGATARTPCWADSIPTSYARFMWGRFGHTGRVLFGTEVGQSPNFGMNPYRRP